MKHKTISLAVIITALLVAMAPPVADAQLLKKISKGLEKVNKGLETVEKALNADKKPEKAKKNKKEKKADEPRKQADQPVSAVAASALADGTARWENLIRRPRLTPQTKFLNKNVTFSTLENNPVSEGIFALQEYNRKYGYSAYFGFWTIDGKCLFDARYEQMGGFPVFDNGAVVVKGLKNSNGFQPVMVLYSDGSARELPESYKEVSQFHDGVATVRTGGMGVKQAGYFCIDTQGNRKWPALGPGDILEVGYLRDGLRSVKVRTEPKKFSYVTRWGFIDDNGKWVIEPKFKDVREFKNGYALIVDEAEKLKFIDTKGNTVYEFPGTTGSIQYAADVSDISDGYFMRKGAFYDLEGNEIKKYHLASGFTDGYAFVQDDYNEPIYVIDTNFEKVRTVHGLNLQSGRVLLGAGNPKFGEARLGTIDKRFVVTPKGEIKIMGSRRATEIGDFYPGDYAPCYSQMKDPKSGKEYEYVGYINRKGEFEVVMSADEAAGGPFEGPYPIEPGDTIPRIGIPPNPPYPLPPVDTIPQGPKEVNKVKYRVKVTASPAEGGMVAGSGEYQYGDTVTIGARANEGWRLTDISCDNKFAATKSVNRFVVRGDMEVTVHFLKKEDPEAVRSGTYGGTLGFRPNDERSAIGYDVPVYLETSATSAIESPYGPQTQGFLAIMIDPDEKLIDRSIDLATGKSRGTFSMNVFFVPMKVMGQTEEDGRKYLLLDGGEIKINNLKMLDSGDKASDVSALETLMVNMMLMFDGASGTINGASYRVEMKDLDEATGAFTFGEMERIDPRSGWIPAGSDVFTDIERGFFITKTDRGLSADCLKGVRMTPAAKRDDVIWTPGPGFFEGNAGRAESFAAELGKNFRQFQSENEILQDLDFKAVGDAYDRLIRME